MKRWTKAAVWLVHWAAVVAALFFATTLFYLLSVSGVR